MPDPAFEPEPKDPLASAAKWLYGLGFLLVGTIIYAFTDRTGVNSNDLPIDWIIDPIRHWMGYK